MQSKRGVDAEFLALLVEGALKLEPPGSHTPSCMSAAGAAAATAAPAPAPASSSSQVEGAASTPNGGAAEEGLGGSTGAGRAQTGTRSAGAGAGRGSGDDLEGRPLCKQVAELLGRVVSATSTRGDARVWEVYARFNEGAGR